MPIKKKNEKPLTLVQLTEYLEPRLKQIEQRMNQFDQRLDDSTHQWEKLKWDVKTKEEYFIGAMKKELQEIRHELSTQAMRFYNVQIDPRLRTLEQKVEDFSSETLPRFDELFKKLEDLRQEYIFINEQMKRLEASDEWLKKELDVLKTEGV